MPSRVRIISNCLRFEGDLLTGHLDGAFGRHLEKIDASEEGALSRARGPDHRYHIAFARRQRDTLQNLERSKSLVKIVDPDSDRTVRHLSCDCSQALLPGSIRAEPDCFFLL
jgi:hypothetical protein